MAGASVRWEVARWWASVVCLTLLLLEASMGFANVMFQCIEGGFHLGVPVPFYGGCNGAIGTSVPRLWLPQFLILDLVFWVVVSWGILVIIRDREAKTPS